jgi:hypothetical protein
MEFSSPLYEKGMASVNSFRKTVISRGTAKRRPTSKLLCQSTVATIFCYKGSCEIVRYGPGGLDAARSKVYIAFG